MGSHGVEGIRHHSFDGHPESRSYMIIFVCPKCFQRNNLIFGINAFRVPGFMLVETVLSLGCTLRQQPDLQYQNGSCCAI